MYQRNQLVSEIFRQGSLSSDMFSFSQMKGVTSSALVDFTCRCTWCVDDSSSSLWNPRPSPCQLPKTDFRVFDHLRFNTPSLYPKMFTPVLLYQCPPFDGAEGNSLAERMPIQNEGDSGEFRRMIPAANKHPTDTHHMTGLMNRVSNEANLSFGHPDESNVLLNSSTDSANMRFFLETQFGCSDNNGNISENSDNTMTFSANSELPTDRYVQGSLGHLCNSYLKLFKSEVPVTLSVNPRTNEEKKKRKYKCPHCNFCCANNGQLKGHMRIHTGEKPFVCDFEQCKRSFARNEELTRHKRIHIGLKPHQCVVCAKSFGRKDHLSKHEKTHLKTTEKKVHVCNMTGCQQSYTRSDALARHQWSVHAIRAKSTKWRSNIQKL